MWIYNISSGNFFDKFNKLLCSCIAGNGIGLNNPDYIGVKNTGPIPTGLYSFAPFFHDPVKGDFVIPLIPQSPCNMFNRSGFFIHGAKLVNYELSSDGCIIMHLDYRKILIQSSDWLLKVVSS